MTKKKNDEPESDVVEMDAMDEQEWERDQHTPMVENAQLQKLVKESATESPPASGTPGKPAPATNASVVKRAGATAEANATASTGSASSAKTADAKPRAKSDSKSGKTAKATKADATGKTAATKPDTAAKAAASAKPDAPSKPDATAKPDAAATKADVAAKSDAAAKPDAAATKADAVAKPDAAASPAATAKPDAAASSAAIAKPDAAASSAAIAKPDAAASSAATAKPDAAASSAAIAKPDAAASTSATAKPDAAAKRGAAPQAIATPATGGTAKPPPTPAGGSRAVLPPPRLPSPGSSRGTGGAKPLSPTSLARPPSTPAATEDPPSSPIRSVLGAFGSGANQSGGSTASVLKTVREASQPNEVPASMSAEPSGRAASTTPVVPTTPVAPTSRAPSPSSTAPAIPRSRAPSAAPIVPPSRPDDFDEHADESPIVPPAAAPTAIVANEASNSTSPGSASFAEAPSSVGREDDSDVAALLPKRSADAVAFLRSPRNLAIAAGGAVLVILLVLVGFKGSSKKPSTAHPAVAKQNEKQTEPSRPSTAATETPDRPQPTPPDETRAAASTGTPAPDTTPPTGNTDTTTTAATATTTETTATTAKTGTSEPGAAKKTAPTLGGKQVVLEYDGQARDTKGAPNSAANADQSAISRARTSYAAGNQRLFAGDADGAISYYKQALGYYPAYVAGYRGLGLAYAQQGNKAQALQAFRTYLGSVPNAKDAGLIRKRISTLQTH